MPDDYLLRIMLSTHIKKIWPDDLDSIPNCIRFLEQNVKISNYPVQQQRHVFLVESGVFTTLRLCVQRMLITRLLRMQPNKTESGQSGGQHRRSHAMRVY